MQPSRGDQDEVTRHLFAPVEPAAMERAQKRAVRLLWIAWCAGMVCAAAVAWFLGGGE